MLFCMMPCKQRMHRLCRWFSSVFVWCQYVALLMHWLFACVCQASNCQHKTFPRFFWDPSRLILSGSWHFFTFLWFLVLFSLFSACAKTRIPCRRCAASLCHVDSVFTLLIADSCDCYDQIYCTNWWLRIWCVYLCSRWKTWCHCSLIFFLFQKAYT